MGSETQASPQSVDPPPPAPPPPTLPEQSGPLQNTDTRIIDTTMTLDVNMINRLGWSSISSCKVFII